MIEECFLYIDDRLGFFLNLNNSFMYNVWKDGRLNGFKVVYFFLLI